MRPVNYRLEVSGTLLWMAACSVIALQYTSAPVAVAASVGAMLGCIAARWAARRSAHLEVAITICPFAGALLLLGCDGLHRAQLAATIPGPIPAYELAEILLWGGTAFCLSLALDLLKAEFPQAAAIRIVLIVAGFVSPLAVHAAHGPGALLMLAGLVIAAGSSFSWLADRPFPRLRLSNLLALLPQQRLHPSASQNA